MGPADLVVYLADPLKYGELLVLEETGDGRFLCEATHFDDPESEDAPPPRGLFEPDEIELKSVWMRQAA